MATLKEKRTLADVSRETLLEMRDILTEMYPPKPPPLALIETEAGRLEYARLVGVYDLIDTINYALEQQLNSQRS